MDRDGILDALTALGERLAGEGLFGDVYVVGGAAMALAYNAERVTRDVDAVFEPKLRIYELAARIADERDLPPDWLNDSVKGLLTGPDAHSTRVIELPGLRCEVASPQMLVALKVLAHRVDKDADDLRRLVQVLELRTVDEVLDLAERLLAPRKLTIDAQFFVEQAMAEETQP
jgi:hypothetical protein